jgi:hypothetical protein
MENIKPVPPGRKIREYRIMIIIPRFQRGDVSLILATRSFRNQ